MTIPEKVNEPIIETEDEELTYCTVHPSVQTSLRCNRCGRPMCTRCAVRTPVGYRCKECVREQQDTFFDAQMIDYMIAGGISLVMSFVAAFIMMVLPFFLLAFFIAPAIGTLIGRVIMRATNKRRGRHTGLVVGVCMVVAGLPFLLASPISVGIYLFMGTGAAVAQFGLRLNLN
ncbi:MAG: hypothetical protein GYB65_08215 [Chloroflexi bacterium]|nr:hypothetical protein [Chloroflexota bacterium]